MDDCTPSRAYVVPRENQQTGIKLTHAIQFEPSFKGTVMYGTDYVTIDPTGDDVTRPDLSLTVFPDDGATPFEMLATGIQIASPEVASITSGNLSEGRKVPYGGIYSSESSDHAFFTGTISVLRGVLQRLQGSNLR